MYFWTSRGRSVNLIIQTCFCQQATNFSPKNISRKYTNLFLEKHFFLRTSSKKSSVNQFTPLLTEMPSVLKSNYSTSNETKDENKEIRPKEDLNLSTKDKLKRAVKDYGATVMIFHISMSLASLGLSYLVISSGVDVGSLLDKVGFSSPNQLTTGASTFVVAYAVHKVFAPVRISITLGCTPFIVRYLRRVGILKPPKSSNP